MLSWVHEVLGVEFDPGSLQSLRRRDPFFEPSLAEAYVAHEQRPLAVLVLVSGGGAIFAGRLLCDCREQQKKGEFGSYLRFSSIA